MKLYALAFTAIAVCQSCAPYSYGPYMKNKEIHRVFQPIMKFMDYQKGMTFADVGASSGAVAVVMATLMDSSTVYIQDIDASKLKANNVEKIIDYYSKECKVSLRRKNRFQIVLGNKGHSNLPDQSIDLIHTNATFHAFDYPDSMLADLHQKLKPTGKIFIRDDFKKQGGASYCSDKKCGKRLMTVDEFLSVMDRNGFVLVKQSPNIDGYPMFGFTIKEQKFR